jgi:hypothetical protein
MYAFQIHFYLLYKHYVHKFINSAFVQVAEYVCAFQRLNHQSPFQCLPVPERPLLFTTRIYLGKVNLPTLCSFLRRKVFCLRQEFTESKFTYFAVLTERPNLFTTRIYLGKVNLPTFSVFT